MTFTFKNVTFHHFLKNFKLSEQTLKFNNLDFKKMDIGIMSACTFVN